NEQNKDINTENIYHQPRIIGKHYNIAEEQEEEQKKEEYYLNSLNLGNEYQYLKEIEHNFYTKKRKEEIIKKFKEGNYGK
ncbi:MAG: hypothetical protein II183_03425, partial [Elusimicrobiaceae bacterium]|nr:hypothetical protein [Elusimicrobiaceae bacterium]